MTTPNTDLAEPIDVEAFDVIDPPTMQLALPAIRRAAQLASQEPPSLATSLRLHLMSEHQFSGALALDDRAANAVHVDLHRSAELDHDIDDLTFRPGLALDQLKARVARHEAVQRIIVPVQRIGD